MTISALNKPLFDDAQNDSATQANQLATAATDAASAALAPVVSAKLPIVAGDRSVCETKVASFVASDNVAGGEQMAKALAEKLGGKGKIIVLEGVPGASSTNERGAGFDKGLAAFPEIKVVSSQPANYDRAKTVDVSTNLLQGNPDVTGVLAMNDEMAPGAIQALDDKAGKSVTVVGFDGTEDGFKAVFPADCWQPSRRTRPSWDVSRSSRSPRFSTVKARRPRLLS